MRIPTPCIWKPGYESIRVQMSCSPSLVKVRIYLVLLRFFTKLAVFLNRWNRHTIPISTIWKSSSFVHKRRRTKYKCICICFASATAASGACSMSILQYHDDVSIHVIWHQLAFRYSNISQNDMLAWLHVACLTFSQSPGRDDCRFESQSRTWEPNEA